MALSKSAKQLLWVGIGAVMAIAIFANPSTPPTQQQGDIMGKYKYACKEFLLKTLHDPASADLGNYRDWPAAKQSNGHIVVRSSGRSKNAFGAIVLGTWRCEVIDDGRNISLVSMKPL